MFSVRKSSSLPFFAVSLAMLFCWFGISGGWAQSEPFPEVQLPNYPLLVPPGVKPPVGSSPPLSNDDQKERQGSTPEAVPPSQPGVGGPPELILRAQETLAGRGGSTVDRGDGLTNHYRMEVLSSTREWRQRWSEPDFGFLRISCFTRGTSLSHGHLLVWQKDLLGNPSVHLVLNLFFPKLSSRDPLSPQEPWRNEKLKIEQRISFCPRADGWLALAGPLQVKLGEDSETHVLVAGSSGQGMWQAVVGSGGLWIEGMAEAGLAACRTVLPRYFRDEEIRLFLQGNSDAIFYLRPIEQTLGAP